MRSNLVLEWKGKDYVITASEAFEVADKVEDVVTLSDIPALSARPKFATIARAYGVMLRHAGAIVTDAEIRTAIMDQIKGLGGGTGAKSLVAAQALVALVEILMDGAPDSGEGGASGEASAS